MNNDLLLLVALRLERDIQDLRIQEVCTARRTRMLKMNCVSNALEKKLARRPTYSNLLSKNIIKAEDTQQLSFNKLHEFLNHIVIVPMRSTQIAPKIAERVKKLDFYLKKKLLINKLEIDDYERLFKKKD